MKIKAIKERLEAETPDEKIEELREKCVGLVKMSRSAMSAKYSQWDGNNDVYKGVKAPDEEDLESREHNEPEKMVVPMSFDDDAASKPT